MDMGASVMLLSVVEWKGMQGLPELQPARIWVSCVDKCPIEVKGATDVSIGWGWCITMACVVVADMGHGKIIGMDALRK